MARLKLGTTKIIVPDLDFLAYDVRHGAKRFRLIAEETIQTENMFSCCRSGPVRRKRDAKIYTPFTKNTINVAPGETWDIEFRANNPGTWAFHCHKPHHMANEHQAKLGGMFTTVKYI